MTTSTCIAVPNGQVGADIEEVDGNPYDLNVLIATPEGVTRWGVWKSDRNEWTFASLDGQTVNQRGSKDDALTACAENHVHLMRLARRVEHDRRKALREQREAQDRLDALEAAGAFDR